MRNENIGILKKIVPIYFDFLEYLEFLRKFIFKIQCT